jgi:hypothetical protein
MQKLSVLLLSSLLLINITGCSTTEVVYNSPYCYTDEIVLKDGDSTISSKTILQCTDRPGQQALVQRAGIDAGCREFWYDEKRNGRFVKQRGVACEKFNGSLEIVNIDGNIR